ncbi:MAG: GxxExxY protein [Candidatus Dojkabacteria bacterium]|nr:GxxExxY protein [Candidatus Dojkabacteria bacterium]MDQ7021252.1 GxxExxY protein [Candidatus Dojkabacteria bacterium]
MTNNFLYKDLTNLILKAAFNVHTYLGPGLLESTYEACLFYELRALDLNVESQTALPVIYKNVKLDCGYRLDLVVEDKVIIELKAVESLSDIHTAQLLTYLKLSGKRIGYLMNFNVVSLKTGIRRYAL